jgi:hypothetical protein
MSYLFTTAKRLVTCGQCYEISVFLQSVCRRVNMPKRKLLFNEVVFPGQTVEHSVDILPGKAGSWMLVFAVVTTGWQTLVTQQIIGLPTANVFVNFSLPQHDICHEMLMFVCVFVCVGIPTQDTVDLYLYSQSCNFCIRTNQYFLYGRRKQ